MNRDEVTQWWKDYQAKFPSCAKWASGLADDQKREVFTAWLAVLTPTDLADALEVNRLMRNSEIPEVGTFDSDREKIGHAVRSEADALVRKRTPRIVRPDDWENDRAKCRHCRDTGLVEVYRPKFLRFVLRMIEEGHNPADHRQHGWRWGRITQCVICSCDAGEEKVFKGAEKDLPKGMFKTRMADTPRFSEGRFYRVVLPCDPNIDRRKEPAELVAEARARDATAWTKAAEWFAEVLEGMRPAYPEFEEFNARDSAPRGPVPQLEFKRP